MRKAEAKHGNGAPVRSGRSRVTGHGSRASTTWPDDIYRVLVDQDIRQVTYVPDSGHARLIERVRADRRMRAIPLTTEEEGVALAVGAWLGGERSILLMQSSGTGNCINMLGMVQECRVPLPMLITMRGEWGEFNPWQVPMSQATSPALTAMGVAVLPVEQPGAVGETVAAAVRLAFNTCRAVAVLISQRVIGAKQFK